MKAWSFHSCKHAVQRLLTETSGVVGVAAGWRVWPAHFTLVLPRPWAACAPAIGSPKGATRYKVKSAVLWQNKQNKKFANYCIGKFPGPSLRHCDFYPTDQSVAFLMQYLVFFSSKAFCDIKFRRLFVNFICRKFCVHLDGNTELAHFLVYFLRIYGSRQPVGIVSESTKF